MSTPTLREPMSLDQKQISIICSQLKKVIPQPKGRGVSNITPTIRKSTRRHKTLASRKITALSRPKLRKSQTPLVQRAFIVAAKGTYELRDDFKVPELENEDEVMIRTYAVGLNPIDWKSVSYNFCLPQFPWVTGREMAGTVEKVGSNVTTVQVGDRAWTSTYYRDVRAGCFQEYVVVPQHTVLPIPTNMSYEEAACLGVAALTASMTMWKWLDISIPTPLIPSRKRQTPKSPKTLDSGYQSRASLSEASDTDEADASEEWMLIYGGSTVTGQFATQIARLSGLKVITVGSARTAALSKSLGSNYVVVRDDKTPEQIMDEITEITEGRISKALDLVGTKTAALCVDVCSRPCQSGRKVKFAPLAMMSGSQEVPCNVEVETVEMKRFVLDTDAGLYAQRLNDLLNAGLLRLPDMHVLEGGLEDIEAGLELVKKGDMGGKKIVVQMIGL